VSDYFDRIESTMRDAVRRRVHLPWYVRALRGMRAHRLVVVLAALVVAAPAVGATTNWFGFGAPDRFPGQPAAGMSIGRTLVGTARLLPLRVPDPQGGPPWGVALVRTTRGDTCIQLGRVENGRLGSLGIDYAWNNDHLFHPFPNTTEGTDCGTTDAAGHGFVNVSYTGTVASANPTAGARGPQASSCHGPLIYLSQLLGSRMGPRAPRPHEPQGSGPACPRGSTRIIFVGLLGPDAASITYQPPSGSLRTERTAGSDGAYLLVFPLTFHTCQLYTTGPSGGYGPCGGGGSQGGASPGTIGAIKTVTYRDGHVCHVGGNPAVLKPVRAFERSFMRELNPRRDTPLTAHQRATFRAALLRFLAKHNISTADYRNAVRGQIQGGCPAVGYVAARQPHLTPSQVESPVTVKILPPKYGEFQVDLIFTARQPVRSSSSWYEDYMTNPAHCPSSGQGGQVGFGDVRRGQVIHDDRLIGMCKGTYSGLIGYMQNSGPINQNSSGGGEPGRDGSLIVGRFRFTVR
jgi:hypothetical protein